MNIPTNQTARIAMTLPVGRNLTCRSALPSRLLIVEYRVGRVWGMQMQGWHNDGGEGDRIRCQWRADVVLGMTVYASMQHTSAQSRVMSHIPYKENESLMAVEGGTKSVIVKRSIHGARSCNRPFHNPDAASG